MSGINIYKMINKKPKLIGYVKSDEEVNEETKSKIREKYSIADELKLLRTASTDSVSFSAYNDYVEQCRLEGQSKKSANSAKIASLTKKTITEDGEKRIIYVGK